MTMTISIRAGETIYELGSDIVKALVSMPAAISHRSKTRKTIRALRQMDGRLLDDIGLTPGDVEKLI